MTQVDILMPTYNASAWLGDFLPSLLRQDFHDWRLIIRDDGSSDETPARLAEWQEKIGSRMVVLPDDGRGNIGVNPGVNTLIAASDAPWMMLADPDDVWLDGKMRRAMKEMQSAEAAAGPQTPIAICTDAHVVDGQLNLLHGSFWKSRFMRPRRALRARDVAFESPALTSTMIFNRALADLAVPIPLESRWQDWWLALVAVGFGELITLDEPTILYRQHGSNLTDAPVSTSLGEAAVSAATGLQAMRQRLRDELVQSIARTAAFLRRYGDKLPIGEKAALEALVRLPHRRPLAARASILRHGLRMSSLVRNVRLMALL